MHANISTCTVCIDSAKGVNRLGCGAWSIAARIPLIIFAWQPETTASSCLFQRLFAFQNVATQLNLSLLLPRKWPKKDGTTAATIAWMDATIFLPFPSVASTAIQIHQECLVAPFVIEDKACGSRGTKQWYHQVTYLSQRGPTPSLQPRRCLLDKGKRRPRKGNCITTSTT